MRIFACQLCGAIDALSGALIDMTGLLEMGVRGTSVRGISVRGTSVRFIHLAPFFVRAANIRGAMPAAFAPHTPTRMIDIFRQELDTAYKICYNISYNQVKDIIERFRYPNLGYRLDTLYLLKY